ncbi:pyroglutamyl-peptidase 1-like [Glandiceps talaboti]
MCDRKTVVVTGFGPFLDHKTNVSWSAVQELKKIDLGEDVTLVTQELPVVYDDVKEIVPSLWKQHKPKLVIHVGVSGIAEAITLEELAHNTEYTKKDVNDKEPVSGCCLDDGPDCIKSSLNMQAVCDEINKSNYGLTAVTSNDPGRYLCDYSYYLSLHQNCSACAFVHVPPLGKPYTAEELAVGLKLVTHSLLKQIEVQDSKQ